MSLVFPDWWQAAFPDIELLIMDALRPVLNRVDVLDKDGNPILDDGQPRRPFPCTFLPPDYGARLPVVRIFRGGGAADPDVMVDSATVQVAVIADTRAESWSLMEFCRQWLLSYARAGDVPRTGGSTTHVDRIEELTGPQQLPELNPDKRLVSLTFRVVCRPPRPRTDYAKVRETLS